MYNFETSTWKHWSVKIKTFQAVIIGYDQSTKRTDWVRHGGSKVLHYSNIKFEWEVYTCSFSDFKSWTSSLFQIVLCRLNSNQLDCVYTRSYHEELAICQCKFFFPPFKIKRAIPYVRFFSDHFLSNNLSVRPSVTFLHFQLLL